MQQRFALVGLVIVLSGCAVLQPAPAPPPPRPVEPTTPIVEPAPPEREQFDLTILVLDAAARPIVGAKVTSEGDVPEAARSARAADGNGFVHFPVFGPTVFQVEADRFVSRVVDLPPGGHRVHLERVVPPVGPARRGAVHVCVHAFCDDDGAFPALGASLFWGLSGLKFDRPTLDANLQWVRRELGADYVRVIGVVGGGDIDPDPWQFAGAFLSWPDYDQQLAAFTDHAYDDYGLRVAWVIFGGRAQAPNRVDQERVIDRFLAMARGREHKIQHFEIVNERWMNGFAGDSGAAELRHLAKRLRAGLQARIPISLSSPACMAENCREEEATAEARAMFAGDSGADLWTPHWSRDVTTIDGIWRHVRQPWDNRSFPDAPPASTNDEPMGPGSSVAADENPLTIAANYTSSLVTGQAGFVYHSDAGIWSDKIHPFYKPLGHGHYRNLWDHPTAPAIAAALKAIRQTLPGDLANWQRTRHGLPDHPFAPSFSCSNGCAQIWPDDNAANGVVRVFAAQRGSDFVVHPIGVKGRATFTAAAAMRVEVLDQLTMQPLAEHQLQRGASFTLTGERQAYVLRGRYQ